MLLPGAEGGGGGLCLTCTVSVWKTKRSEGDGGDGCSQHECISCHGIEHLKRVEMVHLVQYVLARDF